jgi:hypothetical protein
MLMKYAVFISDFGLQIAAQNYWLTPLLDYSVAFLFLSPSPSYRSKAEKAALRGFYIIADILRESAIPDEMTIKARLRTRLLLI